MDTTLKALVRSSHAHAAYAEALGRERSPAPGGATPRNGKRIKALRAEIETADAEVTRLKGAFVLSLRPRRRADVSAA
jgi:hypothetical protein